MSRNNRYGYNVYRGRPGPRKALVGIVVVLVILLLLAVCAFFFFQKYMVYTDDGQAHLELPFLQTESAQIVPAPSAQTSQDIVVVTNPPQDVPTPSDPPPTPEVQSVTHAAWLLRGHLLEGSWKGEMHKAGCDTALFNLKADDGTLGYVSQSGEAIRLQTTATDQKLNDRLKAVTATDQYVIARVSCFKDNTAPQVDSALAIRTSGGYTWRDGTDKRWMDVASPAARAYVIETIQEIADLGVDEILLENSGCPTTGNLGSIRFGEGYDLDDPIGPVETFYQEVREALAGTGVKLSIATSEAVMLGQDDGSGQTLALLEKYADRVYVPYSKTTDYAELLRTRQAASSTPLTPDRLVLMVPKGAAVDSNMSWLILR